MSSGKKFRSNAICIDFDGVMAEFTDNIKDFGEPIKGCAAFTKEIKALGYKVIIHTARPNNTEHVRDLIKYLESHSILFDEINENSDCAWASDKPLADFYIDDRALRFNQCWDDVLWQVLSRDGEPAFEEYQMLLSFVKERKDQIRAFTEFLSEKTNWLTAPASTKFHLAKKGGLIEHSVNVAKTLIKLRRELKPELSLESCVIVALFHDVGKVGFSGVPYYIENLNQWQVDNRNIKYSINPDCLHMDTSTRSLYLITQYVMLTQEEAQAIRYHDGQYVDENKSVAHRESPLTRLLQYADNWSGGVIESANNQ